MGTSNWQQIPFCIDALMRIAPSSVLDIGVGFGRWGIISREFCDVWFGRVMQDQWSVRVEGIEGFERSIRDYHRAFYSRIHVGDAAGLIPTLPGPWSVTIYGDVLEHFTKERGVELLRFSLEHSDYVLVNIPLGEEFEQGDAYGNEFERHLSTWNREEFNAFGLVRSVVYLDFQGRPYASFVLSRKDPRNLRAQLFSRWAHYPDHPLVAPELSKKDGALTEALRRLDEQAHELGYIKKSGAYKWANRLRTNPLLRRLKGALRPEKHLLSLHVEASAGDEAWVLGVYEGKGSRPVPWDFVRFEGDWECRPSVTGAYGVAYCGRPGATMHVAAGPDPEVRLMTHAWSGRVGVELDGVRRSVDLKTEATGEVKVAPARGGAVPSPVLAPRASQAVEAKPEQPVIPTREGGHFMPHQRDFIDHMASQAHKVVAVHCPHWLGVSSSTRILFENCYPVPYSTSVDPFNVPPENIERHARVLAEVGVEHLIVSGGDEAHLQLVRRLRELRPSVTVDLLWHGSYVQIGEDYVWKVLRQWIDAVRTGEVRGIVTVKAGMEDFFRSIGIPSALVLNYVPGESMSPPELGTEEINLGLWISGAVWRKTTLATISALPILGNARIHGAGLDARARELIEYLRVPTGAITPHPLTQTLLTKAIRKTHLSLYVTFSECCPMLPLESFRLGVPCLLGPTSHLFEDDEYLFKRLVVPFPDRADVIANSIRTAYEEIPEIMAAYRTYIRAYNERAAESVRRYIENGPTLARGAALPRGLLV